MRSAHKLALPIVPWLCQETPKGQQKAIYRYALSLSPEGPGGGSGTRIPRFAGAPLGAGRKPEGLRFSVFC